MEIYLAKEWEHALLAFVVKAAARCVAGKRKQRLDETVLNRILYFAKRQGVPYLYKFELSYRGSFCVDMYSDLEYLKADGIIRDTSRKPNYTNYVSSENMEALLKMHRDEIAKYRKPIRAVVRALSPLKPEHLQLIANLDYVFQLEHAKNPKGPVRDAVVERFLSVEKDKFHRKEVEQTYDVLQKAGLLAA